MHGEEHYVSELHVSMVGMHSKCVIESTPCEADVSVFEPVCGDDAEVDVGVFEPVCGDYVDYIFPRYLTWSVV